MKPPIPGRPKQSRAGFDVLIGNLIENGVKRVPNPVVRAIAEELHETLKPTIAEDLRANLGPDTRTGEVLDGLTRHGGKILKRIYGGDAA